MKRLIPFLSVVLNIVLIGAILFTIRKPVEKEKAQPDDIATRNTSVVEIVAETNFAPSIPAAPFDWSQIESEDFVIYAQNLRVIGCPEATVRDILTAEIEQHFVQRRQAFFRPFQNQFWDLMAQGVNDLVDEETQKKLDALGEQKKRLFKQLFPNGYMTETSHPNNEYESLLSDVLSQEKIQQLRAISLDARKLQEELVMNESMESEKRTAIVNATKELLEHQKQLLTAEEREEFKLRKSQFAQQLPGMVGFEASEEELRTLARLQLDGKPEDQTKIGEQIKSLLGEKRFGEYLRSTNSSFHDLHRVARRYEVPKETVAQVDDLVRATSQQVDAVQNSKELPNEYRERELENIREETQAALISRLGVRAAEAYRRSSGDWDKIARP